jgi:hypothetical protein
MKCHKELSRFNGLYMVRKETLMKKYIIIGSIVLVAAAAVFYFFFWKKDQSGKIVIPYIAHQRPIIDPHLPDYNALSDKLDEVLYDGLFNVSANPSGITYEDGLGEFISIDEKNVVTIRLKTKKKWHSSYFAKADNDDITIEEKEAQYFSAKDLRFTLRRIQQLGSLSPDYILVGQAIKDFAFEGPDINDEIRLQFSKDRIWIEPDIKEILSFKLLPHNADLTSTKFNIGSGPYLIIDREAAVSNFYNNPDDEATIPFLILEPFIDNSTFSTELSNNNINVMLETPFGSLSPILADKEDYFFKSNISTTFFALMFNTERLNRGQREAVRNLLNRDQIIKRFYKTGSEQQRHISDYKGNKDNYEDYLNFSVFPSSSYYVDEQIVYPSEETPTLDFGLLPDSIRVKACLNYGFREEYSDLIEILNDPTISRGKLRVSAVKNEDIKSGDYDALLIAVTGYSSKFLFDLYDIFLREPDLARYKISLQVGADGKPLPTSFSSNKNFFRLDPDKNAEERDDILRLLEYIYGFMDTREIGDKQVYAQMIHELEQEMALGTWLFSLPSLAYFTTQFDEKTIDLYGVASQLSTIEKWEEKKDK